MPELFWPDPEPKTRDRKREKRSAHYRSVDEIDLFIGCAKQKRPVYPQDCHKRRNIFVLQDVSTSVFDVIRRHQRDRGRLRNPINVEQRGESHAHFNSHRQVRQNRQRKGGGPDRDVGAAQF